jgi:histidinol-phosphate aminotransferase
MDEVSQSKTCIFRLNINKTFDMKEINISKLVKPSVSKIKPYEVKDISCKVKLDANESPYSIKVGIDNTLLENLNRYPDSSAKILKREIAKSLKIGTKNILLGNGSDELIYYLTNTFGGPVLYPTPTFSMYNLIPLSLSEKTVAIKLDKNFDLDMDKILFAIKRHKPKLIFISSPNNPTGNCFSADRILKIIEKSSGIVVVDEAYQPFSSKKGFLPLLRDYKNLAILRTFSKIGFAALRVGYLIGHEELISEVNKVRLPFNLNSISQALAIEALKNKEVIDGYIKAIVLERQRVYNELSKIKGLIPYPSEANFILFKVKNGPSVFNSLIKEGVLVRNMDSVLKNTLRVTIGKPEENDIFLEALKRSTEHL